MLTVKNSTSSILTLVYSYMAQSILALHSVRLPILGDTDRDTSHMVALV